MQEERTPDWNEKKRAVMKEIMKAKALQHKDVQTMLLSTNESIIVKNHPLDYYWGTGEDGSGKNVMGEIWMEIRSELREDDRAVRRKDNKR